MTRLFSRNRQPQRISPKSFFNSGLRNYVSSFTSLGQLTSSSGLSIASGGGLIATTSNVQGTGSLTLAAPLNATNSIFRFAALIEVNDAFSTVVQLADAAGDFKSGAYLTLSTNGLQMTFGGSAGSGAGFQSVPAGTRIWFMIAGDRNRVTISFSTLNPTAISSGEAFQGTAYNKLYLRTANATLTGSGSYPVFTALTRVLITNRSATNRILGVFSNVGSWDFLGNDGLLNPPMVAETQVLNDRSPYVMLSGNYGTAPGKKIAFFHHPNGNAGSILEIPTEHATRLALWAGGYTCVGMSGLGANPSTFAEATMSPWGAPAGLYYRKFFVDYVRSLLPRLTDLFHVGSSMGALIALEYQRQNGGAKAIVTVSGAVGLADCFTNRGFSSTIQKAYGDWYVCIQAGTGQSPASSPAFWTRIASDFNAPDPSYYPSPYVWRDTYAAGTNYSVGDIVTVSVSRTVSAFNSYDPTTNTARYAGSNLIPISMSHSSGDTLIPIAQRDAFANNLIANGGNVTTATRGTGHITADVYDPAGTLAFFNANA